MWKEELELIIKRSRYPKDFDFLPQKDYFTINEQTAALNIFVAKRWKIKVIKPSTTKSNWPRTNESPEFIQKVLETLFELL